LLEENGKRKGILNRNLKMAELKVSEGENCCGIEDQLGEMDCPSSVISIKCKHMDRRYIALKCKYDGACDYKKEITSNDLSQYPELFKPAGV
jgi:hypothetical protein